MSTTAPVSEYAATLMFENSACTVKNDKQLVLVNGVIHLTTLWSIKTGYYAIGDNFVKCEPIFTISALFEEN